MSKKAVIFDRDGTLIVDVHYLNDPNRIEYLPTVFDALTKLKENGYVFAIATNQSGIPRGIVSLENLNEIHRRMKVAFLERGIEFLDFYYAPYMTDSDHPMRKPNPGMLEAAAKDHDLDLSQSWMIGDRRSDVESGHRAGARSILLGDPENDPTKDMPFDPPEAHVETLLEAANFILQHS